MLGALAILGFPILVSSLDTAACISYFAGTKMCGGYLDFLRVWNLLSVWALAALLLLVALDWAQLKLVKKRRKMIKEIRTG